MDFNKIPVKSLILFTLFKMFQKKIIPAAFIAASIGCSQSKSQFDEDKWLNTVNNTKAKNLYVSHYKNGRFYNPWLPMKVTSLFTLLKWKFSVRLKYTAYEETYKPPVIKDARERILSMASEDFIMWIGHNTFLVRIDGNFWITDPIFFQRAFLPKRKTPPGITLNELKEITDKINVVITHNHYDHLDKKSIEELPDNSRIIVPMGVKKYVEGTGKKNVKELDWWQTFDCGNNAKLICLPAQHWSRRITQRINTTLWASYMLITPSLTIYFRGDSGYFIGYKEIGRKFPNIDYAFLPTTAYHPRWFMHYAHINIEEALRAFEDLGAKYLIPTQWGTFRLGDNPVGLPAIELKKKIAEQKLNPSKFLIMDIGEIIVIP